MRILTSTLASELETIYDEFVNTFGFGPCGVYSTILRKRGYGQVAVCEATVDGMSTYHYVIIDADGDLIDLTNPFDEVPAYTDIDILNADEMPDLVDDEVISWIQERI